MPGFPVLHYVSKLAQTYVHWFGDASQPSHPLSPLTVKNLPAMQETQVWSLSWEDSLEKSMATHSSILAWRVPGMKEPGGLLHFVYSFVYWWTFGLLPSAAMNMGVKISLWDSAFNSFGYISKVRLLDYLVVLNFWETSTLFSILVAPFYNIINMNYCSNFSTSSPTFMVFFF